MEHAILIPHRGRHEVLADCLASIDYAYRTYGSPWPTRVIVAGPEGDIDFGYLARLVEASSGVVPLFWAGYTPKALGDREPEIYNKAEGLNVAIDAAIDQGAEVVTFLDCDMVVGPQWGLSIDRLEDPNLIRLCYRVRNLPIAWSLPDEPAVLEAIFDRYDDWPLAYEAYGSPTWGGGRKHAPIDEPVAVFGNSQYSIELAVLGDLRHDERHVGRGFEDLDLIDRIATLHGARYEAEIVTDGPRALLHRKHAYDPAWQDPNCLRASKDLYYGRPDRWPVG